MRLRSLGVEVLDQPDGAILHGITGSPRWIPRVHSTTWTFPPGVRRFACASSHCMPSCANATNKSRNRVRS